MNNRNDVGKSGQYEVIMTKDLLYDLLDNMPPLYQIISLFLAHTGLRISDAIRCLVYKWDDLQYFSYDTQGRYYLPEIVTEKRKFPIHQIFISQELMLLLDFYVPENYKNKIEVLLKKSNSYFSNKDDQIRFLQSEFRKKLKKTFEKIKHRHSHVQPYQTIRAHLLRKYYITQTDQAGKELGEDYLRYISGHKPLDPLFLIYKQHLRIAELNLKKFIQFIEPSVEVGFSKKKIRILTKRKSEISEFFQLNFLEYLNNKIERDYFSFINILEFFLEYKFQISSEEINQLILEMIEKGYIQRFGTYFSFTSENKINTIQKHIIFHLKNQFMLIENKGISFFELSEIILQDKHSKVKNDVFKLLKRLLQINIIFVINDKFYINEGERIF